MADRIKPHLMFIGDSDSAIELYTSLFEDSDILEMTRWTEEEPGETGQVKLAVVQIAGRTIQFSDSPNVHDFTFTPSLSLFVTCVDEGEIDRLATALGEDGKALMPLGDYGFSQKFAWIQDRFGVSWQLNLE